jgi:hypothetical protein
MSARGESDQALFLERFCMNSYVQPSEELVNLALDLIRFEASARPTAAQLTQSELVVRLRREQEAIGPNEELASLFHRATLGESQASAAAV